MDEVERLFFDQISSRSCPTVRNMSAKPWGMHQTMPPGASLPGRQSKGRETTSTPVLVVLVKRGGVVYCGRVTIDLRRV